MRVRSPSSRASTVIHFSLFDLILAAVAPFLALYLRSAQILSPFAVEQVFAYVTISFVSSLIGFAVFRIHGGIPGYLSVHDVLLLAKAVLTAELLICAVMFSVTRLDGVPRSAPAIHALILGGGLFATRMLAHLADKNRKLAHRPQNSAAEHIILIGVNDLSDLFLKLIESIGPSSRGVVGVLDENPRWTGRSLAGIPVFGPPEHLASLIDEFAVHGIGVDRVVVAGGSEMLSAAALEEVRRVCGRRHLALAFVGDLFNLVAGESISAAADTVAPTPLAAVGYDVTPARYFRWKRLVETLLASLLVMSLAPFWLSAGLLAIVDVGPPILFWQRRIGLGGHPFQLYKIRTLHHPVDRVGRAISEERRVSWIGRLLRQTRIDELPQLLSVLVGDMSLVGPRPLLPQDQPADPTVRLMVRPGMTGWAQVNGGSLLAPEEKEVLDAWYVGHASLWLDLRILAMTLLSLLRGDRRSESALSEARRQREFAPAWFAANGANASRKDRRRASAARSA
jgi:lipopolysaccharide/colanic/teichoic acid biosynthesis glycosyltransferase